MVENKIFPYKIDALKQINGVEYLACKNAALVHIPSLEQLIKGEMKYPARFNGTLPFSVLAERLLSRCR